MPVCPDCHSSNIKKNGFTHYGKQNHRCKTCGRQFVLDNHHTVDEQNGIYLDGYHYANVYVSKFKVMGNVITSIYRVLDDSTMLFELFFNSNKSIAVSGDTIIGKDTIAKVDSYYISTYQRAYLKKQD